LLYRPKVLLLDEPATGLDPTARLDLRRQLKELNLEGVTITILISSHILSDLEDICTRVAPISAGRNTADAEGHHVIQLAQTASALVHEVEVAGSIDAARTAFEAVPGTTIVKAEGTLLVVKLNGGTAEGAALLRPW
jgi:ABC-2 type transport system ATP-binding protein